MLKLAPKNSLNNNFIRLFSSNKCRHKSPFYYSPELEKYEQKILGSSFKQFIPSINCFSAADKQIEEFQNWSLGRLKNNCPEHMMSYKLFTNVIYPKNKYNSIEDDLVTKLKWTNQRLQSKDQKKFIAPKMTLTGRSGDGKTFFLYRLADRIDECIVLPIHVSSAHSVFVSWIRFSAATNNLTIDSQHVENCCNQVLISYLVELEKLIDQKCQVLEIMCKFNSNRLIKTVFNNITKNNLVAPSVEFMVDTIFQKTGKTILLVLDEAHIFTHYFTDYFYGSRVSKGSLLTALTRSADIIPMLFCSTMIHQVNLDILQDNNITQYFLPTIFNKSHDQNPVDFIEQFINMFDNEIQKQHVSNLLLNSSVRFCTMVMDEYIKLCICKEKNTSNISRHGLLIQTIRNVFVKRMTNYEVQFDNFLMDDQSKQALMFLWTGLIPDIAGKCFVISSNDILKEISNAFFTSTDSSLKIGVADSIHLKYFEEDEKLNKLQFLLSFGCGFVDSSKPGYFFSDPFFRMTVFKRLKNGYEKNLTKSFKYLMENNQNSCPLNRELMKGFYFERIIALLMIRIESDLDGQPITSNQLFKQFRGSWLDGYTLRVKSAEHDSRYASGLIGLDMSDLIITSMDDNSFDLFVSLVSVNDYSNIGTSPSLIGNCKIPFLIKIYLSNNSTDQKLGYSNDFMELLKYSNHSESKCLSIVFSNQNFTELLPNCTHSDQLSAIYTLQDEIVKSVFDFYFDSSLSNILSMH